MVKSYRIVRYLHYNGSATRPIVSSADNPKDGVSALSRFDFQDPLEMDCDSSVCNDPYGERRAQKKRPFRIRQNKLQNEMPQSPSGIGALPPPFCEAGATLLDEEGFPLWKLDDSLTDEEGYPALSLESSLSQRRTTVFGSGRDEEGFPVATGRPSRREMSSYSYPCDRRVDLESGERTGRKVSPVRRLGRYSHGCIPEVYASGRPSGIGGRCPGTSGDSGVSSDGQVDFVPGSVNAQFLESWFGELTIQLSRRTDLTKDSSSGMENT
ncbi:uncharacterized protein LOC135213986 isoform X5 [Macrobrachium nipponense]|uniref:uncharacterized protein LOC135213986 isoform X4 n=1 Tax=Macrobrachium nipponense TaxID=159736 RepID=UPI0030C7A793